MMEIVSYITNLCIIQREVQAAEKAAAVAEAKAAKEQAQADAK